MQLNPFLHFLKSKSPVIERVQADRKPVARRMAMRPKQGFSLTATMVVLALLLLVAVGIATLAQIASRAASMSNQRAIAQQNAILGLKQAIGELQLTMGPDQMISANAAILEDGTTTASVAGMNSNWLGAWHSWHAGEDLVNSSPSPDEPSDHRTIPGVTRQGMHPTYLNKRRDHFGKWLLSLTDEEAASITTPRDLTLEGGTQPEGDADAVCLVGAGTLGEKALENEYVRARLIGIQTKAGEEGINGRYGWWVGDESQKAKVMADAYGSKDDDLSLGDRLNRQQSPGSTGTKVVKGLEKTAAETELAVVPSLKTLDLVTDVEGRPSENYHAITTWARGVLADVREGGLKRDLSTLLSRPINLAEDGDEFMLYRFDDQGQERVPIQDLAAYYQLYDNDESWDRGRRGGIEHGSGSDPIVKLKTPDFGGTTNTNREKYLREYTSIYRNPVPIRVEHIIGIAAQEITQDERDAANSDTRNDFRNKTDEDPIMLHPQDTHKLLLLGKTVVTLWNPNSVPLVMNSAQRIHLTAPPFGIGWTKYRDDGALPGLGYTNLAWANAMHYWSGGNNDDDLVKGFDPARPIMMSMRIAANEPVVFQPGEVKIFTLNPGNNYNYSRRYTAGSAMSNTSYIIVDAVEGDVPGSLGYIQYINSSPADETANDTTATGEDRTNRNDTIISRLGSHPQNLVFNGNDVIAYSIRPTGERQGNNNMPPEGLVVDGSSEIAGAVLNLHMADEDFFGSDSSRGDRHHFRHYQLLSRYGSGFSAGGAQNRGGNPDISEFNRILAIKGFPLYDPALHGSTQRQDGRIVNLPVAAKGEDRTYSGANLISALGSNPVFPIAKFVMGAGCETYDPSDGTGRVFATRPFLHGSTIAAPIIDNVDYRSLYNIGWQWQLITDGALLDIQFKPGTGNGFFGGGYTQENGATHVVQQDIPIVPLTSIAALSHAHLGGFSLADSPIAAGKDDDILSSIYYNNNQTRTNFRRAQYDKAFRKVTATGHTGFAPRVMQPIGNSYAHPNIPADEAYITWAQVPAARQGDGTVSVNDARNLYKLLKWDDITFADHSYLANKALWDDYFFSSITEQTSDSPVFEHGSRSAREVTEDFFNDGIPLPDRRMRAVTSRVDQDKLDGMFARKDDFTGGLADEIAAYLLVDGSFNVNSTSVQAWKVLLSSLRNKAITYVERETGVLKQLTPGGVPVGFGSLPSNTSELVKSADIEDSASPPEQWSGWREITDEEIDQLAKAIVKQVKLRGPFLSLSEFVNRRLDKSQPELSVKGALQAAIDDPNVSINANFRTAERSFSSEEINSMTKRESFKSIELRGAIPLELDDPPVRRNEDLAFPEALEGPVAYGSAAYVDQADVLRHFGNQLTVRGDTFVIRSYGDAVDANGKVTARAWCEAVIQRMPYYVNDKDPAHLSPADSTVSEASRRFGRKFEVVSFRWLHPSEI